MNKRTLCIVAYDITEDRRRARALKAVRAFGLDGQKSVHECALTASERRELEIRLSKLLDPGADRLLVLPLDPRSRIAMLGQTNRRATTPLIQVIG